MRSAGRPLIAVGLIACLFAVLLSPQSSRAGAPRLSPLARERLLPMTLTLTEAYPGAYAAAALWRSGKPAEALIALDQAQATAPRGEPPAARQLMRGALLLELDRSKEAVEVLAAARERLSLVEDVVDLHLGAALALAGNPEQGSAILKALPKTSTFYREALLRAVELDLERSATAQALVGVGALIGEQPWQVLPPDLLLLLGQSLEAGAGKSAADMQAALRAYALIDARYPRSGSASEARGRMEAIARDRGLHPAPPTFDDRYAGAMSAMRVHRNEEAIVAFTELLGALPKDEPLVCDAALNLARAYQKERAYTDSLPWLQRVDTALCDSGARVTSLFLQGRAYARKGEDTNALRLYQALVERFPEHSMADDAMLLAATIHQDNDEQALAEAMLRQQLQRYPDGDMAAQAAWRLAWAAHHQGRSTEAVKVLEALLKGAPDLPVDDTLQARYWIAWLGHGIAGDDAGRRAATDQLAALASSAPLNYYGWLAAQRLSRLDADAFDALNTRLAPPAAAQPQAFNVTEAGARLQRAALLYTAGLQTMALRVLEDRELSALSDDQRWQDALMFEAMGQMHKSTWLCRGIIGDQHLTAPTPTSMRWLALGYPLPWADHVEKYSTDNGVDPRLLLGLMREESNFDANVRSWAGASGLTQLMWPTAKETARKLGLRITQQSVLSPETNIRIGARYLGDLLKRFSGNAGLAVPGYNAGAGSVSRWLKERGDQDFDVWVEEIPYDQTRDYVKRVLGSYQTYHHLYRSAGDTPWITVPLDLD